MEHQELRREDIGDDIKQMQQIEEMKGSMNTLTTPSAYFLQQSHQKAKEIVIDMDPDDDQQQEMN